MTGLQLEAVTKRFGATTILDGIDLEIGKGEFTAILGPSGCGKTTTLHVIAGFTEPESGRVLLAGKDITHLRPEQRDTALVFQNYALFPHMTVRKNIEYGLKARKVAPTEAAERISAMTELLGIGGLDGRYPNQLSGGQQQRVAVARALVVQPEILLLDEPLSNLDEKLRKEVRIELRSIQRELEQSAIIVTHDHEEALSVADRLVVMDSGRIVQSGTPEEVFSSPRTRFVADFMGFTNIVSGSQQGGVFVSELGARLPLPKAVDGVGVVALRPSELRLDPEDAGGEVGRLQATVADRIYLGGVIQYRLSASGLGVPLSVEVPLRFDPGLSIGDRLVLGVPAGAVLPLEE